MAIRIEMPKLGLNMKEGLLVEWLAKDGEKVEKDQPLFIVETEKVTNEVTAQEAGILHHVGKEGESFPVLGLVGFILAPGESVPSLAEEEAKPALNAEDDESQVQKEPSIGQERSDRILASPKAKRRAEELGLDLNAIEGTGPDGRISFEDVENAVQTLKTGSASKETLIPMTITRKTIARHMSESHQQTAPVTLMSEGDASSLVAFRDGINQGKTADQKISYNAILVKLAARLLREYPLLNASYKNEQLVSNDFINIGLATDLGKGLLVPVVHHCDEKSLGEINQELQVNLQKITANQYTNEDLSGNTFTITNLGAMGITYFTPVINLPDMAILGVGKISTVPVERDVQLSTTPVIYLSLTFDHRWVDGTYAAKFLQAFIEAVGSISDWMD